MGSTKTEQRKDVWTALSNITFQSLYLFSFFHLFICSSLYIFKFPLFIFSHLCILCFQTLTLYCQSLHFYSCSLYLCLCVIYSFCQSSYISFHLLFFMICLLQTQNKGAKKAQKSEKKGQKGEIKVKPAITAWKDHYSLAMEGRRPRNTERGGWERLSQILRNISLSATNKRTPLSYYIYDYWMTKQLAYLNSA